MTFGVSGWPDNTTMTEFEAFFEEEVLSEVSSDGDIDQIKFIIILLQVDLKEKEFHGIVREITILCLISIILYIGSFAFLNLLR